MFKGHIPQVVFGEGALSEIGSMAKKYGSKAILTIDPFLDKNGTSEKVETLLQDAGISVVKWTDISPNPSCFLADDAGKLAKDFEADMVIAVGGGSAIDFGKAVSVVAMNPGKSWEYTERSDHPEGIKRPQNTLPVIAVPTTSGTGSESTPFSVLNNTEIREKSTIVNDTIYVKQAIVDPDLMVTMPKRLTASTGFDAFAHCVESYISLSATPFSKMVAKEGMKIIAEYLPKALADGNDRDAREKMAWGSLLGGSAIGTIGVTLPHSLGQPVGGFCNAPHGESVAACMVEVLKDSWQSNPIVFAEIADILNPEGAERTVEERAESCADEVQKFLDKIGLHVRFSDFGLTEADIPKVTSIALTGYYFDIKCHPKAVTKEDIMELYKRCL